MIFLIKFCGKRPKRTLDKVESAKYDEKKKFYLYLQFYDLFVVLDRDFSVSGIRIFGRSGSGRRKKSSIRILKKNPDPKH